jgi:hypothetical protein
MTIVAHSRKINVLDMKRRHSGLCYCSLICISRSLSLLHVSYHCTDPVQNVVTNDMKQAATTAEQHSNHIDNNAAQNEHISVTADTATPPTVVLATAVHTLLIQCRAPSSSVTDSMQPAISDSNVAVINYKTDDVVSKLLQSITSKDVQSTALIQQLQHSDSVIRTELERREADVLRLQAVMHDRTADMKALMQLLAVNATSTAATAADNSATAAHCNAAATDAVQTGVNSVQAVARSKPDTNSSAADVIDTSSTAIAADSGTAAIVLPEQCSSNVTTVTTVDSEVPHTPMAISASGCKSVTFNVNNSGTSSSLQQQQQQQQQQFDQVVHSDNSPAAAAAVTAVSDDRKHCYTHSDGSYLNDALAHTTTNNTTGTTAGNSASTPPMLATYGSTTDPSVDSNHVAQNSTHHYDASKLWRRADLHDDNAMTRCSSWQGSRPTYSTVHSTATNTLHDVSAQQHNSTDIATCTEVTPVATTTTDTIPWTRRRSKSLGRIHHNSNNSNNNSSLADLPYLYQFLASSKR